MTTTTDAHGDRSPAPGPGPGASVVSAAAGSATATTAPPQGLLRRVRTPLVVAGAVGLSTLVVALRDPHDSGSYGYCPLYALTGLWCPACGGLRATHDLARGDLAGAWGMNPLWVLAVPFVVGLWALWTARRARGRTLEVPRALVWTSVVVVAAFGVLRNLPPFAGWLAP